MFRARKLAGVLATVVVVLGLPACGKREINPAVTGPTGPTATGPTAPSTTTAQPGRQGPPPTATNPPAGSGGTPAPVGKSHGRAAHGREAKADFRKYCETHPGACGD
jgi:hypothetical protein